MQYPALTVCKFNQARDEEEIAALQEFPKAPREDVIARYIYHSTLSNGLVLYVEALEGQTFV